MKKLSFLFYTAGLTVLLLLNLSLVVSCSKKEKTKEEVYPFLRLGFQANTSSKEYLAAVKFAEEVDRLSEGTVSVKIFPNGVLGDDISMIKQVAKGTLDMTYAETGRLGLWVKEAQIFSYPFVFDDFNHLKRVLDSEYGQELHKRFLDYGWRVLATGYNGTRQTTSNRPIYSIKDMKGMKLRVPKAHANIKFAEYSGADPVIMPFNEVYPALKAELIDGQENPLSTIEAQKFFEVQKYCALTSHILNDCNFLISEKSFNILSERQQNAVIEAAKAAAEYQTELFRDDEIKLLGRMADYGMTITKPDIKPFRKACKPLYDEYRTMYGSAAISAISAAEAPED